MMVVLILILLLAELFTQEGMHSTNLMTLRTCNYILKPLYATKALLSVNVKCMTNLMVPHNYGMIVISRD